MWRKLRRAVQRCILLFILAVACQQLLHILERDQNILGKDQVTVTNEDQHEVFEDGIYQPVDLVQNSESYAASEKYQHVQKEEKDSWLGKRDYSNVTHFNLSSYAQEKIKVLQNQVLELITKYNRESALLQHSVSTSICKRYAIEGKTEKVFIPNVWKQFLNFDRENVVFVSTQMHEGKLSVLDRFIKHWDGGISVALYVNMSTVYELPQYLSKNYPSIMERKNIDLHLVAKQGEFYPINYLRNIALKYITATYIFLCDVDFIPNFGLHQYLQSVVHSLLQDATLSRALVIAAFEFPRKKAASHYPKNKTELLQLWSRGRIRTFHPFNPYGQSYTKYDVWKNATKPYQIKFKKSYEPYLVMRRTQIPAFDPRFLGRYKNKVAHRYEIAAMGTEFVVLPDAFLVHYPHHVNWRVPYGVCSFRLYSKFKKEITSKYRKKRKKKIIPNLNSK